MTAVDRLPVVDGDTARVRLTQGQVATIDAADAHLVAPYTWGAVWVPELRSFYAVTQTGGRLNRQTIYMHRLIAGGTADEIDHIDHDTLDNRRTNLRCASAVDNRRNRGAVPSHNTSGFLGVYRSGRRWAAQVRVRGRGHHVGSFDTPEQAARARDQWIRDNHPSEFWTFNFPRPTERGITRPEGATA